MKAIGRRLEWLYTRTGLIVHKEAYQDHKDLLATTKSAYFSNIIRNEQGNPRLLFSIINKPLRPLDNPSLTITSDLCDGFLASYQNKGDDIYQQLQQSHPS
jgi:hypothetical protein